MPVFHLKLNCSLKAGHQQIIDEESRAHFREASLHSAAPDHAPQFSGLHLGMAGAFITGPLGSVFPSWVTVVHPQSTSYVLNLMVLLRFQVGFLDRTSWDCLFPLYLRILTEHPYPWTFWWRTAQAKKMQTEREPSSNQRYNGDNSMDVNQGRVRRGVVLCYPQWLAKHYEHFARNALSFSLDQKKKIHIQPWK